MKVIKGLIRQGCPPFLLGWIRRIRSGWHNESLFEGNYVSWADACEHASGYDANEIFQRVRDAAWKVKRGEAVFERDSVCFHHEEYRWEVLACLLLGAGECGGRLNVLDFGGALGGFYFQHRKFFSRLKEHCWGVVEQRHFVECGRDEFGNGRLRFYSSIEECAREMPVEVILLSSVMQYLEKPYELLAELGALEANYIIVDRTPFMDGDADRFVVQRVPENIFPAILPVRIFSEQNFDDAMKRSGYSRVANFPCAEQSVGAIRFNGMLYRRGNP